MRIISGSARGKRLATFSGEDIRPTSDRAREALFSILTSRFGSLNGLKVLDLYAGSGAMALEAVSRGAENALCVDKTPQSAELIESNIATCKLGERVAFIRGDARRLGAKALGSGPYDLIFIDPPYDKGLAEATLTMLSEKAILAENGIICVETGADEEIIIAGEFFTLSDERRYGATKFRLYNATTEEENP
jgi:16S rRNA (guanine966-N2)-methyltransferase